MKAGKWAEKKGKEELDPVLIDKVCNYLEEYKKAGLRQIAKDLNLENSTVIKILIELKKLDKVKLISAGGRSAIDESDKK